MSLVSVLLAGLAVALLLRPRSPGDRGPGPQLADDPWDPSPPSRAESLLPAVTAACAGLAALALVGGPLGPVVGIAAAAGAFHAVRRMEPPAQRRRREHLEAALPHAVDLLAACLAAGHAPDRAVDLVAEALDGPLAEELAAISFRLRLGVDPVTVWRATAAHPQLGALGRCVSRAVDSGASVSEAMSRLAGDLRRDARSRTEARARSVGVRAALPLGVCMLPAFLLVGVAPLVASSLAALLRG